MFLFVLQRLIQISHSASLGKPHIIARYFSCFYERPLRIDAYCYIRQLQLTNYNCIIVYALSLTAIKWKLLVG